MLTYIYLAMCCMAIVMLIRNNWVFARRTELNRFDGDVHLIRGYADYNTMMLRFWVWDIDKFKTPNAKHNPRSEAESG